MDLARLFRREALSVAWRHQAKGILWRVVPDHRGGLIGEERDPGAKGVSFFRVLLPGGSVVWSDVTAPGGWWTGIECVTEGALLVHGFASPDLPGHRGLTALDLRDGATLWNDEDMVFVAAADGAAYGLRGRPDRRELVGRELLTGVVRSVGPADDVRLHELMTRWQAEAPPPPALPEPVEVGTGGHDMAASLLAGISLAGGGLELLRVEGVVVSAHHELMPIASRGQPAFRRVLSVFSGGAATPAYRETLDENLTMPVPEAFLVIDRTLLFVMDRKTLCAVHLSGAEGRG